MADPIADRVEVALRLGEAGAATSLRRFQAPDLDIQVKPDGSLVTEGDFAVNDVLVSGITEAFQEDGILSEEQPRTDGASGYRWVLDPIDGTSSYAAGLPTYSILIGIERDRVPVAGVVMMPAIGEALWGARGAGVQWRRADGHVVAARVSTVDDLSAATIEASSATAFAKRGLADVAQALATAPKKLRGWSEGWSFAMVTTGRVDAAVSLALSRWDIAPYVALLEEAGGRLTGWDGGPAIDAPGMVGSNGHVHEDVRSLLRR